MRLICPNCGAQYEVPSNVIPEGGRDVQCSSCGHTWFQAHPDDDPELALELGRTLPDEDWQPEPDAEPETPPDPEPEPIPEPEPAPSEEQAQPETRRPRGLDPSVAEVLREEAERETRQRAAEAETLESQPELGLEEPSEDEAARRSREARERMARMRGEFEEDESPQQQAAETAAAAAAAGSRRELLPDIEEINQTLRASSERRSMETPQGRAAVEEEEKAQRSGFSNGFRLVLALAIFAIALYMLAPKIAEMFPGAGPIMAAYVAKVDVLRLWLDGQITALLQMLDGMSSEAPGD
ncbi:zinc-ribbon domain-containing protein [Salipiger sp. P9]|uniref:zinc-ribbon domain-containing protein n=1 Tax=Salipiger pentaromativorans TaxID=2943193 RepID=UPI0021573B1C|nr:zinc-ribbon domain-containing protein [Salipiger pentaromativorans]MCR8548054.1 zinc-ribbon domain-containing protein [Salipiger pentaromativorans]